MDVQIEPSWKEQLNDEFQQQYFLSIVNTLKQAKAEGKIIYPAGGNIFNAFKHTPFDQVKVVIIGQDPYHNASQAHGLSFSVPEGIASPPSLINIYKELNTDLGYPVPVHGNLTKWAAQGVLLLNASLTVEENKPMSHAQIGWHLFTDRVIQKVSEGMPNVVFMLWGKFAQSKENLIDKNKHLILKAAHPSPFSAYNGFFGCRHFSKANGWLIEKGIKPIDWQIE